MNTENHFLFLVNVSFTKCNEVPELDSGENLLKLQDCTEECLKSHMDNMQCFLISFGEILSVCNVKELETVKKNFVRILQILVDPSDIISRETVQAWAYDDSYSK